jgi:hypothetical protein
LFRSRQHRVTALPRRRKPSRQRFVSKDSTTERNWHTDPDASWGHRSAVSTRRGGGFFGYRLHTAVCTSTGLPVAWQVETAKANESPFAAPLIDTAKRRGALAASAACDKGYDVTRVYAELAERDCLPLIPLRKTTAVKNGEHLPPTCGHGVWTFAGANRKRGAAKWRCPTGECSAASTWVKACRLHPLIPRETDRFKGAYRSRARVRSLEVRMGTRPAPRARIGPGPPPCRPEILTKLACALSGAGFR